MDLKTLLVKINMPKEVINILNKININNDQYKLLVNKDKAFKANEELLLNLKDDNLGFKILKAHLLAALLTYQNYQKENIRDEIYFETMSCFTRFVNEYKESFNKYGFDRGFWTYRQLAMLLFKVGILEYEIDEENKIISLHIPSKTILTLENAKNSLLEFKKLFPKYASKEYKYYMNSWLLSPSLDNLLNKDSNILKFKKCFKLISFNKYDDSFFIWVYKRKYENLNDLPTNTSLEKNMKEYLLNNNYIGSALGELISFDENESN